jgi:hypothetical protein
MTTKGDLLTRDSSALARLGVGADGQVLTADSVQTLGIKWAGSSGWDKIVVKETNEFTTTSIQDDDELFVSVSANKTYYVHLTFIALGASSSTMNVEFSAPASATFTGQFWGSANNGTTSWINTANSGQEVGVAVFFDINLLNSFNGTGAGSLRRTVGNIYGILTTDSTAGTLTFRFGNTTEATVYKGSVLRLKDIT